MLISTDGMRNTEKVHDSLIGFWQNVLAFFFPPLTVPVCDSSSAVTKTWMIVLFYMFEANHNELSFYPSTYWYQSLPNTMLNFPSALCVWMASWGTYFCTV